jgi:hypothetical protein
MNLTPFPPARILVAALSLICTMELAQAASVQVNVNKNPAICSKFLETLRKDKITSMAPRQLCNYDFVRRNAGSYYRSLDWKRVPGDPVALAMKIYDANLPVGKFTKGTARSRAIFLAYAQDQNRHHALTVDVAPFRLPPLIHSTLIHGYVLRSLGSYCGKAANGDVTPASYAAGRVLVAFFADKALQKPIPDFGRNQATKSFPVKIKDWAVVVGIDTSTLDPHVLGPAGPGYSADIEAIRTFRGLPSEPHQLLVNPDSICAYTVFVKSGLENGVK